MADNVIEIHRTSVKPITKFFVFVGIYMARLFDSIIWLWANLSIYVNSYYYSQGDVDSIKQTNWVVSLYVSTYNVGLLIGGPIRKRFGFLKTLFLATFLYNGSILYSYLALQQSVILLIITFGVIPGLCGGISESCRFQAIVNWTNKYYGLSTSSLTSSSVLASAFTNLMFTMFVNPNNVETDTKVDEMPIFTQIYVVDRAPEAFLFLGAICSAVHFVGFFMLRENPGDFHVLKQFAIWLKCLNVQNRSLVSNEHVLIQSQNYSDDNDHFSKYYGSDVKVGKTVSKSTSISADATPLSVLKRRDFYTVFICNACQMYGIYVNNTYYKSFGLLYIKDDHFLTYIGMINLIVSPFASILGGLCIDKFGVKVTLINFAVLYTFVISLFYLTVIHKWAYLVACVLFNSAISGVYCALFACCLRLFGKSHYTSILGMALSSTYILTFVQPPLSQWIIDTSGYFPIYVSTTVLGFIHVLMCIWGLPETEPKLASLISH